VAALVVVSFRTRAVPNIAEVAAQVRS